MLEYVTVFADGSWWWHVRGLVEEEQSEKMKSTDSGCWRRKRQCMREGLRGRCRYWSGGKVVWIEGLVTRKMDEVGCWSSWRSVKAFSSGSGTTLVGVRGGAVHWRGQKIVGWFWVLLEARRWVRFRVEYRRRRRARDYRHVLVMEWGLQRTLGRELVEVRSWQCKEDSGHMGRGLIRGESKQKVVGGEDWSPSRLVVGDRLEVIELVEMECLVGEGSRVDL